jgi:hypothetical protein
MRLGASALFADDQLIEVSIQPDRSEHHLRL